MPTNETISMNLQQVLNEANALYEQRRHEEAREAYLRLIDEGAFKTWAYFSLGRIARDMNEAARASECFDKAIANTPDFFWAYYERLVLWNGGETEGRALEGIAKAMAGLEREVLSPIHIGRLELAAHRFWDIRERDAASMLLRRLWPSPDLGDLALVRIVEAGDPADEMVVEAAARLEERPELSPIALRVLAEHHRLRGEADIELDLLERYWQKAPKDFGAFLSLAKAYVMAGEPEKASEHLASGSHFPPKQIDFAGLIVALEAGRWAEAFLAVRNHARLYGDVPKFPGIRLSYALGEQLDTDKRDEVIALLDRYHPNSSEVGLLKLNESIRDQDWERAKEVYRVNFEGQDELPSNVRLARIQMLAHTGELEVAGEMIAREVEADGELSTQLLRTSMFIFAELGRWDQVFETGLAGLATETSFEQYFSVMVRAARKTGRTKDLFELLNALSRPLESGQLAALHAVMEDLVEAGQTEVLESASDIEIPAERQYRFRIKERANGVVVPSSKDISIYYCADEGYMLPALVSLTSLALSNYNLCKRVAFAFVVESELVDFALSATSNIAKRFGLTIEIVDVADIISSRESLRTEYGIFTGGQTLSLAAYYRIFFAKHLAEQGRFSQALYIDADTSIRGGLDRLFEQEMTQPLMARRETDRAEVRHAVRVHGMKGSYFNSGVLRFDFTHPDTMSLLDGAISNAIDPNVELIFQDQCALNRAFDQSYTEMDERFNFFITPDKGPDGIDRGEAVVLHYLDRPKPWDGLYRHCAKEWFDWLDLVESFREPSLNGAHAG